MSGRINRAVAGLVIEGLRRCAPNAILADEALALLSGEAASIPLEPYRALLEAVVERAGRRCLLEAGQALRDLNDPLLFVLLNSDSAELLIEKEARLSRFIHSRHVVRLVESSTSRLVLEHVSLVGEPP